MSDNIKRDGCPRCGEQSVSDHEYGESLKNYVDRLDPETRVSQEIYDLRLNACRSCEYLSNGVCRLCGCFTQMRAAKRSGRCPASPGHWNF